MESSGSDLMVFFSVLLDVRCVVPFSEDDPRRKDGSVSMKTPTWIPHGAAKISTSLTCDWYFALICVVVVVVVVVVAAVAVVVMSLQFISELLAQWEVAFWHVLTNHPQVDWSII